MAKKLVTATKSTTKKERRKLPADLPRRYGAKGKDITALTNPTYRHSIKPGDPPNPFGTANKTKRHRSSIREMLESVGDMDFSSDPYIAVSLRRQFPTGYTKDQALYYRIYYLALKGVPWAVHFIADRREGKSLTPIQITDNRIKIDIENGTLADLECRRLAMEAATREGEEYVKDSDPDDVDGGDTSSK